MLRNTSELMEKIDLLWKVFWSERIFNPLTIIEQITYLLFMKRIDNLDIKNKIDAQFADEFYASQFDGTFIIPGSAEEVEKETLRWSYFKQMPAEEMFYHVQQKVFPFLRELSGEVSPFTKYMKNAAFIIPKASLLVDAIKIIEEIFQEIEKHADEGVDIEGGVYEILLKDIATAGKNGQFCTPRHIIKLITELVEPQFGHHIADPACGSGGFLLGGYQYILTQLCKQKEEPKIDANGFIRSPMNDLLAEDVKKTLGESLFGYDIDVTMVRLGLMNLMMHGIDMPNIDYKDALYKEGQDEKKFDIIMTNPPFTGSIDKGEISGNLKLNTTRAELLFIERTFNMLKVGGTAGIIVPQRVLFGTSEADIEVRKLLVEQSELKAVITMPMGVFKPYAGVGTAILIFTKGRNTQQVWFYEMQADGYSLDNKRNKLEGEGDLQDIVHKYKNRDFKTDINKTAKHFFISKKEIVENKYDLYSTSYKEDVFEFVDYEKPSLILQKLHTIEKEIVTGISELGDLIK
ncbi:class I SAM-dependent DNA methyltransferase [Priestia aryabhattai]|uniref:class I SAM-dependent DNA methyltransferase n=1 Tax=Priestia aryabhattai TaxID=412384 RepID=UPI001C8DE766|nr:N-6 DNA methylase [Priestia aryabhattai]MBX9986361.1 N-6 DNA methylase [Priestia aryabhattai]MBY0001970.1 N-6 DNA methylase [Priestia aryabhattai]